MASAPRLARLTRPLGRLNGLSTWQRPLRPLRTAARRALLRVYPPAEAGRYLGVVAPVVGAARMELDPRSLIEWEVLFVGYEPEVRELLRRSVRAGQAVDVGANAGAHTLAMAATGAEVVAVEPNPVLRARLERNVALNGFDRVRVVPLALGTAPGTAVLHVPADPVHTGGASLVAGAHEHLVGARQVEVEVTTLDALVERERIAPRLVKIDVEGYEAAVLAGGRRTLERDHPDLAFEYTQEWWEAAGASLDSVLAELRGLGYTVRMVTWRGLLPIPSPAPARMNLWASARPPG